MAASGQFRGRCQAGLTHLEEIGSLRTSVQQARPWTDHLERHRSIHKLLEISAWKPLGFQRTEVMHKQDPKRVLSGKVIGERRSSVKTYSLPAVQGDSRLEFLFAFQDIGASGVRRWIRLENEFSRGIHAFTFSIRHRGTSLDGLISDSGIGLEEIGHQIDTLRGGGNRRGHHAHLLDIAHEVDDLLPFDGTDWATESTGVYNDVKHADRPDPAAQALHAMLIKNRLVFRVWLARRIGVSDSAINKGTWRLKRGLPDT